MRDPLLKRRASILLPATLALIVCAGCFSTTSPGELPDESLVDAEAKSCACPDDSDLVADQVIQLVNLERAEVGLAPVVANPALTAVAEQYACRMIEEEFFGHRDPLNDRGPGERAIAGKYSFYAVGENLAAGQETPAEVMKVWMESPSHQAIILDEKWTEVGVAVRVGGEYSIYWVQEFGDPADYQLP